MVAAGTSTAFNAWAQMMVNRLRPAQKSPRLKLVGRHFAGWNRALANLDALSQSIKINLPVINSNFANGGLAAGSLTEDFSRAAMIGQLANIISLVLPAERRVMSVFGAAQSLVV